MDEKNTKGVGAKYPRLTSTFFNSNSGLWAKHKFPNVSLGPLDPCNLSTITE